MNVRRLLLALCSGILFAGSASAIVASPADLSIYATVTSATTGDADTYFEPGETFTVAPALANSGGTGATGISATLSTTTPGVTIVTANTTYPDIGAMADANTSTPFVVQLGATATCGRYIDFTLTVTYTGGSAPSQALTFSEQMGAPGTVSYYSYSGSPVPIPDAGAIAAANLAVSGTSQNVYLLDVVIGGSSCNTAPASGTVGIDHTYVSDLDIAIRSPSGAVVQLVDNAGGNGVNFCQTTLTNRTSPPKTSIQAVTGANAPFTGSYYPFQSLRTGLDGVAIDGTWSLLAQDTSAMDTGSIRAFTLAVVPAVCDFIPPASGGGGGGDGGGSDSGGGGVGLLMLAALAMLGMRARRRRG